MLHVVVVGPGPAEQREERCTASGTQDHFAAGDAGTIRSAGLPMRGGSAPSPRVPVAIRSDAASRIAAASAAVTITTGVFIITLPSPRVVANKLRMPGIQMAWKNNSWVNPG